MSKYIYEKDNSYMIRRNNYTYGNFPTKEDAVFIRELLNQNNWDLDEISQLSNIQYDGSKFLVIFVSEGKIKLVGKHSTESEALANFENDISKFIDNPFNSKYGLNIYKMQSSFAIIKRIKGKDHIFGFYKYLDDATFIRNILRDNDWSLDGIDGIQFNNKTQTWDILTVYDNKVKILGKYESESDALNDFNEVLLDFEKSRIIANEPCIQSNGKLFAIHKIIDSKFTYFGSFKNFEDACASRDILIKNDWDLSKISPDEIHHIGNYYWRFIPFEKYIKIIGKFLTFEDAFSNQNNLSETKYKDIFNSENQYAHVNRNIIKRSGKFEVTKRVDGERISFGIYDSRDDAIKARDEFEANGWQLSIDDNSIFNENYVDNFQDIIFNLSMWQKLIYDSIDKMDCDEFSFDELINHNNLKRYKTGNFNVKVHKHLDEVIDLGLVEKLGENSYRRLWD